MGVSKMDFNNFKWLTKAEYKVSNNGICIYAPAHTNYFIDPTNGIVDNNMPFFYEEVEGDFVFKAKVSHEFISTYDACVLFAYDNEKLSAKACFEYTDLNTHSVVSVITNEKSDDANGIDVNGNELWLQLARKENVFAIHYSLDGIKFRMSRICSLPMKKKIKVGLAAQSPMGEEKMMKFEEISLEEKSLLNIREGNH